MTGLDRQQWLAALILMITALFISAGLPLAPRWRRRFRLAAVALFVVAMAAVLVLVALWWAGSRS